MNSTIERVTQRIAARSAPLRSAYLARIDRLLQRPPGVDRMGCANVAHAFAAMPDGDKRRIVATIVRDRPPNIAVVTAYNDMLSAHQPYEGYPALIRDEARANGAIAQVAGGVPAMCDGVTQGLPGMELSLFSRDTIAMGTAIALTHDVFDAVLLLGICDKIVPGLLIGALHFGHLPCVFVPAGPMSSGLSNHDKSAVREQAAQGLVGRDALLQAESAAYHGPGTCTFYGTANSNQMLLEAMGLHVPGAAFLHPHGALRDALTRAAVRTVLANTAAGPRFLPIGRQVDERVIVNAMVALLATGGSTNHLIHWVAVARAAGIVIDWTDFADLSAAVPLLARVYPNGHADVNQFQAAGGPGFVLRELLAGGCLHGDVAAVDARGISAYGEVPELTSERHGATVLTPEQHGTTVLTPERHGAAVLTPEQHRAAALTPEQHWAAVPTSERHGQSALTAERHGAPPGLRWRPLPPGSTDTEVVRTADAPFSASGGLRLLQGNLGRAVIKTSSVPDDRLVVEAPARVFASQEALHAAFTAGELDRDVVVVVRFQGPRANGMPELHKLTPPLAVLQGRGFRVALVTDGRMSGASGRVPAAIHASPEALAGGPLALVMDGDLIRLDAEAGTLQALVDADAWAARLPATLGDDQAAINGHDLGRELFAGMRRNVRSAEEGAVTWL